MKILIRFSGLILCYLMCLNLNAHHGHHHYNSLEKRVAESDLVIEGRVIQQEGHYLQDRNSIVTCSIIEIFKVFKGETVKDQVCIISLGGTIGNLSQSADVQSSLFKGMQGIFFLKKNKVFKLKEKDTSKDISNYVYDPNIITLLDKARFAAADKTEKYNNLKFLYDKIEKLTGKSVEKKKLNLVELKAQQWSKNFSESIVNNDLKSSGKGDIGFEIGIENYQLPCPEIVFDVYGIANVSELKETVLFTSAKFMLEFDIETFGTNLVEKEIIKISKQEVIDNKEYTLKVTDEPNSGKKGIQGVIVEIFTSDKPNADNLYPIGNFVQSLIEVTIKPLDSAVNNNQTYSSKNKNVRINLESNKINTAQFYDPKKGEFKDFDPVKAYSPPYAPICLEDDLEITPDVINAGERNFPVGSNPVTPGYSGATPMTIKIANSTNFTFSQDKGKILFKNALNPNSWFPLPESYYTWLEDPVDNEIIITIPNLPTKSKTGKTILAEDEYGNIATLLEEGVPGSGRIMVENANGDTFLSNQVVNVGFALSTKLGETADETDIFYSLTDGTTPPDGMITNGSNGNGGFMFILSDDFATHPDIAKIRTIIEDVFCAWTEKTEINITLDPNFSNNLTPARDGVNLICLSNNPIDWEGGVALMQHQRHGFIDASEFIHAGWTFESDIVINPNILGADWYYIDLDGGEGLEDPIPPVTNLLFDFYSLFLHEVGHVHGHFHVIEETKLMNGDYVPNQIKREIDEYAENGGQYIMATNEALLAPIPALLGSNPPSTHVVSFMSPKLPCSGKLHIKDLFSDEDFTRTDLSVYPNPTTSELVIKYKINIDAVVKMQIFDIFGKRVVHELSEHHFKGEHQKQINVQNLPDGFYFVELQIGKERKLAKFLKQ